jgi:hypothetical protein
MCHNPLVVYRIRCLLCFLSRPVYLPPVNRSRAAMAAARILPECIGECLGQIVFIQGKGSMLIVIISIRHFKEVTHEKDIQRNPV